MENYKTTICLNYEKGIECRFGDKCNFAHGENEIRKTKCKFGIKCYNKNTYCKFEHNEESEVNDNENIKDRNNSDNMVLPKDDDFPEIIKTNNINNKKYDYKYSEILTSYLKNKLSITEDINYNNIDNVPKEKINENNEEDEDIDYRINVKNQCLRKLENESKDWSLLDEDYEKIIDEIKIVKNDIRNLKDEKLNDKKDSLPNININFVENDNKDNMYDIANDIGIFVETCIVKMKDILHRKYKNNDNVDITNIIFELNNYLARTELLKFNIKDKEQLLLKL